MAIFTAGEATASLITEAHRHTRSGAHAYWSLEVIDADDRRYTWIEPETGNLAASPTTLQIREYVYDYLTGDGYDGVEKKAAMATPDEEEELDAQGTAPTA